MSSQRAVDPVGLQAGELADQRLALGGGEKKALPAVVVAGLLHDIAFVEQLLEHPPQRLLGDAQHVQQVGDLQAGIAVDEMQHPVMRPAEPERLELMVGVADEIAVGEEQQLDDIPAQIGRLPSRRIARRLSPRIGVGRGTREIYVSHIDISWVQCYKTISRDEILDRFVGGDVSERLEKAKGGGEGRELVYRAIVERHFGKHTGLPHSAKACPGGQCCWQAGRPRRRLHGAAAVKAR